MTPGEFGPKVFTVAMHPSEEQVDQLEKLQSSRFLLMRMSAVLSKTNSASGAILDQQLQCQSSNVDLLLVGGVYAAFVSILSAKITLRS